MFLVPASIVFAVFFGIFSIKPEIVNMLAKQDELEVVNATLDKTQERNGNIMAQKASIDGKLPEADFVDGYVPEKRVSEKIVHEIHQIATETEVTLVNISPVEERRKIEVVPEATVDPAALLADPFLAANLPKYVGKPETFSFNVQMVGEYPKIKNFIDKVFRENSINSIQEIKVARDKDSAGQSNMLQGRLLLQYGYIPPVEIARGPFNYDAPIFNVKAIDFGAVEELKKIIMKNIPDLIVGSGEVGKDNPFVQ